MHVYNSYTSEATIERQLAVHDSISLRATYSCNIAINFTVVHHHFMDRHLIEELFLLDKTAASKEIEQKVGLDIVNME